ncbi:MAG: PaaI family thioesterase [Betaproteobacteria bacterium]|jgi:uncharacterized protein (TIGR00369 family)|nr:PaaI family thioesterase [Betaproteobacteria bacterium]NBS45857.1 PaaI family thioesterase [Betaproteobacteria bacterium]
MTHAPAHPRPLAPIEQALSAYFAPWIQAMGLQVVAASADSVTLRLPCDPALAREGGMVCGQALMAVADTAMALALVNHFGGFRPCTTVQMNTTFLKPLAGQDGLVTATVLRAGRSLAFGEIDIRGAADHACVARASTTYALLAPPAG